MTNDIFQNYDFFPADSQAIGGSDISDILHFAAKECFSRLSFSFPKEHIERVIKACLQEDSSDNDKFVCASLLKNALISLEGKLPLCQDTGIANIFGWVDDGFSIKGKKSAFEAIKDAAEEVYTTRSLRFSTNSAKNFYDEIDPRNNMPPQVSIFHEDSCLAPIVDETCEKLTGEKGLSLIFCAKGGGSSNKTTFIQGTKANLNEENFEKLLAENIKKIGTSACPPYSLAVVAGGLSPEQNLLALKLATCGAYEKMTYSPNDFGFRDKGIEEKILEIAENTGYGAQFGGKRFALSASAIRLPRHGASCPISIGVSCSAHRNLRCCISKSGVYIEKTVSTQEEMKKIPGFCEAISILEKGKDEKNACGAIKIDTSEGIKAILEKIGKEKPGCRLSISGKILVARDKAHARWKKLLDEGKELPEYTKLYPICYAGPSETPAGYAIGSFGPTTAGRMDSYADILNSKGASLITLAKGNRSDSFINACKTHGAVYLGTPGGIAALIAKENITSQEILDYEDLGMEAVRLVTVKDLSAFVLTNANGEDFYKK